MLKPASFDPDIVNAMERFVEVPEDFGPQKLQVIYPNVGAGKDEAAFKVLRDQMRDESKKQEQRHQEEKVKLKEEVAAIRAELEKERASKQRNVRR